MCDSRGNRWQRFRPKTLAALIIIYVASILNINWLWGILFFVWIGLELAIGETTLVETIRRKEDPFWFWFMILNWTGIAAYLIAVDFI